MDRKETPGLRETCVARITELLLLPGLCPSGVWDQSGGENGNCCGLLSSPSAENPA